MVIIFQQLMSYFSQNQLNPQRLTDIRRKICRAMFFLKTDVNQIQNESTMVQYKVALKQKKNIQVQLFTLWTLDVSRSLKITIQIIDQDQSFLQPDSTIHPQQVIGQLNRQSFLGNYFVHPKNPKFILFRHHLPWQTLRGQLSATIEEIFWQISETFTKYTQKLKLINSNQQIKSHKVHVALIKLRHLKQQFELNRIRREKSVKYYNLSSCSMKIVDDALKIIGGNFRLLNLLKNGTQTSKYKEKRCKQVNDRVEKDIKQYKQKMKESNANTEIARGIQINKVLSQNYICEGGFSQIYKGQYIVNFFPTINPQLLNLKNQQINSNQVKQLVKKTLKKQHKKDSSFQNQLNFLKFIRNEKYQRISRYYLPTMTEKRQSQDQQLKQIFLEYYQNNLYDASKNWSNLEPRLNICQQLFESISFLAHKGILHRDLKELNVLVDNQNNIKLIDFGSSCGIFQEKMVPGTYTAIDNDLMATQGYYFPFYHLQSDYRMICKEYTKEQYYRCDTFDLFSAGTIMAHLFNLDFQQFDSMVHNELIYLASKCHQRNPADRLKAHQAEMYIFTINQLSRQLRVLENRPVRKSSGEGDVSPLPEFIKD